MTTSLEYICRNFYKAKVRKRTEEKYNLKDDIYQYKKIGCYECNGHNKKCSYYFENTPEFILDLNK